MAIVEVAWDASFESALGEPLDLTTVFPNEVYGGCVVADTISDGGYKCTYVRGAAGAPSSGVLQAYGVVTDGFGLSGPLLLMATAHDPSAMTDQRWVFFGR